MIEVNAWLFIVFPLSPLTPDYVVVPVLSANLANLPGDILVVLSPLKPPDMTFYDPFTHSLQAGFHS